MNIVVCLKQVPDTSEVKLNPETNTLIRDGVQNIMNPFDRQALETALILKDASGAKVTVVSMGPPQAEEILKEAISMGADEGILVSDRALAGSDTLATSFALAGVVKSLGDVDLVLCGKQAVDGDTAQVGPEMAEHLGMPQVTGALKVTMDGEKVLVERENESTSQTLAVELPALVTVTRAEKEPRFASIKGKMKARKAVIPVKTAAELGIDTTMIGLSGSPTKVRKVFTPPVPQVESEIITEEDADKAVDMLLEKLVQANIITR